MAACRGLSAVCRRFRFPAVPVPRRFSAAVCLWLAVLRRRPSGCGHGSLRPPPALPVHPDLLLYPT